MSYGVSFVNVCGKIDRVITAPNCTDKRLGYALIGNSLHLQWSDCCSVQIHQCKFILQMILCADYRGHNSDLMKYAGPYSL